MRKALEVAWVFALGLVLGLAATVRSIPITGRVVVAMARNTYGIRSQYVRLWKTAVRHMPEAFLAEAAFLVVAVDLAVQGRWVAAAAIWAVGGAYSLLSSRRFYQNEALLDAVINTADTVTLIIEPDGWEAQQILEERGLEAVR